MTFKKDNQTDRVELFKYCLDLNMPDRKKKKVFNYLYEEYRITHEMYKDIKEHGNDMSFENEGRKNDT